MRETELAAKVVERLVKDQFEVYQEVQSYQGGPVADIVAVSKNTITVIEVKCSMSLVVMAQAYRWKTFANFVYIAVPTTPKKSAEYVERVLRLDGIGLIKILPGTFELIKPKPNRRISDLLIKALRPEHKYYLPAGSCGGQWTPFKGTVRNLEEYVKQHPGCGLSEAVSKIELHYRSLSTARTCLADYIRKGVISSLRIERVGKKDVLFYQGQKRS